MPTYICILQNNFISYINIKVEWQEKFLQDKVRFLVGKKKGLDYFFNRYLL